MKKKIKKNEAWMVLERGLEVRKSDLLTFFGGFFFLFKETPEAVLEP